MRNFIAFVLAAMILSTACEDEPEPIPTEVYHGTYFVDIDPNTIGEGTEQTDSVKFTVEDGYLYSLLFYSVTGDSSQPGFCDCSGTLDGYPTNNVIFNPTVIHSANCDDKRLPQGTFTADFRNHGDTIWFDKNIGDTVYQLRLKP
ncbi:MAG: hypothetical protein U9R56_07240 [candidate division Zixibacteria bacterium]|nr:hypothetical protein [candidate division Zixibacteria bacterium]